MKMKLSVLLTSLFAIAVAAIVGMTPPVNAAETGRLRASAQMNRTP